MCCEFIVRFVCDHNIIFLYIVKETRFLHFLKKTRVVLSCAFNAKVLWMVARGLICGCYSAQSGFNHVARWLLIGPSHLYDILVSTYASDFLSKGEITLRKCLLQKSQLSFVNSVVIHEAQLIQKTKKPSSFLFSTQQICVKSMNLMQNLSGETFQTLHWADSTFRKFHRTIVNVTMADVSHGKRHSSLGTEVQTKFCCI